MKKVFYFCISWLAAILMLVLRATCRLKLMNDCRPELRKTGKRYIYAGLHGQAIYCMFVVNDDKLSVMVSRSTDGALVIPFLKCLRITAVRGSSRKGSQDKGGASALKSLVQWIQDGGVVGLTVDGPRGPRAVVKPGIIKIAEQTNSLIIPLLGSASRTWTFSKSWDKFEIPKPFSTVQLIYGQPFDVNHYESTEAACAELSKIIQGI